MFGVNKYDDLEPIRNWVDNGIIDNFVLISWKRILRCYRVKTFTLMRYLNPNNFAQVVIKSVQNSVIFEFRDDEQAHNITVEFSMKKTDKSAFANGIDFITSFCEIQNVGILKSLQDIPFVCFG